VVSFDEGTRRHRTVLTVRPTLIDGELGSALAETAAKDAGLIHAPAACKTTTQLRSANWHRLSAATALIAVIGLFTSATATAIRVNRILEPDAPPTVRPIDTFAALFDTTPIALTITAAWQKVPMTVPAYVATSDHTLWLKMHFDDWNKVPESVRETALVTMMSRYREMAFGPERWASMSAEEWDRVPQPIRAMAFIRMAQYWSRHYRVGRDDAIPLTLAADTTAAIVMVESWFEHRGAYTNRDGTRDLGLGGASAFCRERIRALHRLGAVDVGPDDAEYANPWTATRVAAIWLGLMIHEAGGDLDMAIAAYHAGIGDATSDSGQTYAANVRRKRQRFIRNVAAPPAWTFLFDRQAAMLAGLRVGRALG
jgi:hypothetical protein